MDEVLPGFIVSATVLSNIVNTPVVLLLRLTFSQLLP